MKNYIFLILIGIAATAARADIDCHRYSSSGVTCRDQSSSPVADGINSGIMLGEAINRQKAERHAQDMEDRAREAHATELSNQRLQQYEEQQARISEENALLALQTQRVVAAKQGMKCTDEAPWCFIGQTQNALFAIGKNTINKVQKKNGQSEVQAIMQYYSSDPESVTYFLASIDTASCNKGFGPLVFSEMDGAKPQTQGYVHGGGNNATLIGDMMCFFTAKNGHAASSKN